MASKCRKFEPNIFNKLKCQACFGAKDAHSAEALENNKASRKIAKCGYLFIAPDFDFNNPLDRSRRWQRRLFRLYDDGELTYCVDEDPETIPQGIIDMNKCTAVNDGEKVTSHQFSIEIVTPNKKFYIKGTSKEEFQWWFDVLQVFPSRLTKTKNRRFTMPIFSNKENVQPISTRVPSSSTVSTADTESVTGSRFSVEKVKPKDQQFSTYRGVRNMKHNKTDKHYQEGLRKSSSLHDLTSADQDKDSSHGLADMRFLSRSGDRLDIVSGSKDAYPQNVARVLSDATFVNNPYFTIPRHTWQSLAANIKPASLSLASNSSLASSANSSHHAQQSAPSTTVQVTGIPGLRRSSFDDKSLPVSNKPRNARERAQLHRERSTSLKDFTTQMSLAKQDGNSRISLSGLDRLSAASRSDSQPIGRDARPEYESRNNETDELKMAKSSELQQASRNQSQSSVQGATAGQSSATSRYEDLMYMKKGWLIKQGTSEKDWKKHWFVLTGTSLRYFKDAKAEETNTLDGRIDLTGCYDISEINVGRNYGFKIKTNNGEYVLSAMTSGIRNNWMKAIRLVMDLQHGNKNADSDSNASHSTADDLEVSAVTSSGRQSISSIDSRSGSESPRQTGRKDSGPKNVRRHYSDVSPGNVGKMLSIKDTLTSLDIENISTPLNVGLVRNLPQDKKSEDQFDSGSIPETSSNKSSVLTSESEPYLSASSMSSMSRYVEGSDNVTLSGPPQSSEQKRSESKKEEDERRRRAKSPSARIKEKTRSISPSTTSPQRKVEEEIDYQLSIHTESDLKLDGDDKHTVPYADDETDATSQDVYREQLPGDSMHSTSTASSGGGDGMLVELLENEVDHLKEQLDSTQKELVKMHESNIDLKTRLQTAVREKDISQHSLSGLDSPNGQNARPQTDSDSTDTSQVTTMRRQVKEARDVIQKQKAEIENLRSKLDMSVSKLTGTEKALSESLKDLKLEKDKFMKMSSDWTRRIRNLEAQLKDSNQKFERQKDSAAMKDKECRRLENEVKTNLQKIREHEREILKLKAVEAEYKMLKEKMDEIQSKVASLRAEVKEKEMKCKKLESVYESQINEMEQEFSRERDAVEQHMEDMKKKWMEAQREASMPESWADVVQEKDDIISQLEEKVFENDKKVVEMTEELQAEINENVTMQHRIERLQDEKTKLERKLDEIDRLQKKHLIEKEKLESENRKLRHQLEEARIENKELKLKLEASSQVIKDLEREKHDLELSVSDLHDEMDELQRSHDSAHNGILNHDSVQEVIHNFLIVEAEINEVSSSLVQLRNGLEDFSSINKEDSQVKITELVDIVKSISDKCEHLQDILKEGSAELKREEKIKEDIDLGDMRDKYEKALVEATKLRKELDDTLNQFGEFERKESSLKEEMKEMEIKYLRQIESMGERVDELTTKSGNTPSPKRTGKRKSNGLSSSFMASKEIEEQLDELEERINYVDKILKDQEANMNASDTDDSSDEDDSDDFLSSGESEDEEEDHEESSMLSGLSDSQHVLSKLDEMKSQLRMTNSKIKSITDNMTQDGSMNESDMDGEFRKSLQKCTEKIETLTSRLTEREKHIKSSSGLLDGSSADNSLAFQQCLDQMKAKLHDINNAFVDHEYLEAKDMVMVHEKMTNLLEYVEQLHSFKPRDFDILGKISKQEARASSSLMQREHSGRKRLSQKEKLRLYADRLSVEAILLGQMAYLVQRNQIGNIHRDILLREIQEINGVIFELEKRINYASRELGVASDGTDPDLVSTYAAMLAEKVVLEGQLASCTMAEDNQSTDDTAVLASLHIPDNPSILAMEVFMRSQLDSSLHQELQKSVQDMNSVSGHVMSKALLLGEVTHALQKVKGRFTSVVGAEELHDLIQRERKFSHECLLETLHSACSSMDVYQALVMSCLSYHIRLSQNPGIIESLTTTISERFGKQITDLQQKQNQASEFEKDRIQNVILALEEGSSNIKTLLQNCCDSEDLSNCDFNVTSIETTVLEMCEMLILQCLVKGSTAHLTDMFRSGKLPALPSMESLAEAQHADQNDVSRRLSEILLKDASKKQTLAVELKTQGAKSDLSVEHLQISDLDIIPDLCMFDMDNLNSYAQNLVREAMYQTQLTYTNYKHKIQHEKDMRDLKIKLEAGQKVDLPSESSKDAENDIQQSLSVFEEILETKFEDECEVLSILDKEMKQLQSTSNAALSGTEARQFDQQLKNFASVFEHELSVAQERHDVHLDVLRQEITNICIRMEKMAEAHEREKEVLASHYEEKMQVLKDELDCIKEDHEEELEQVRQDILTAVSAIRANEERSDEQLVDQLKEMTRQMASQKENFVMFLENVHKSIPKSGSTSSLSAKLEEQIGQLHSDGSITPDLGNVMPPVPMSPPPREEESALEAAAADGSNEEGADRCLLDKSHHSYELQMLKREKEQALAEEVKTTKAALDAMRKAYEDDLEVEKSKYREAVKTMCTEDYVNEIKHRHEAEVGKLSDELKQVTMHYDSKCEDYKLMEDKVESIRREYDSHIQHLNKSNEQLNKLVNEEIGKLKDFIQNRTMATVPGNATIEEELYDAQIMVRVKDAELQKLRLQVKNLENNLERATEEQRNSMTQYLQMYKKYSELNNKMKQEETQKDSPRETNRSLRRTPSFHHRARSPSPQASPKKDEHHSRDSHKRRHIDAKDLKRSKSSPSIPYVMDGRLPSASSTRQQRESIGSSSSKYVKPSKR